MHGPLTLAKLRTRTLKKWATGPKQLEEEEKCSRPPDPTVASILAFKKLSPILAELRYSDMAVLDEVYQGVQLTGGVEVSGRLNLANKPATKSTRELRLQHPSPKRNVKSLEFCNPTLRLGLGQGSHEGSLMPYFAT